MADIAIRKIAPRDIPALNAMWRTTFTHSYGPQVRPFVLAAMVADFDTADCPALLPGLDEVGLCACAGGVPVASMIYAERHGTAYVWGAYVHPEWQRRGIGSRLLRALTGALCSSRQIEIRVLASSPQAIAFWQRHGFAHTGEEDLEIAPHAWTRAMIMSKNVAPKPT